MIYRLSLLTSLLLCLIGIDGSNGFHGLCIPGRGGAIAGTATSLNGNHRDEHSRYNYRYSKSTSRQGRRQVVPTTLNLSSSSQETPISAPIGGLDTVAIVKYLVAIAVQLTLVTGLFVSLDRFLIPSLPFTIPFGINAVAMYFLALKSRVFNPLSNRRPKPSTKEIDGVKQQRIMPTWTPPGFIFPIVWLLLIGPLRAITSAMIIKQTGMYTTKALLSLMLHLSIGDVWNTINNVEQRYGTSVLGVLCVWSSAAYAAYQYYLILPLAGKLFSLKLIWLTIATSLIIRTWQLNPKTSGKLAPLLPTKGDGETNFEWFSKAKKE